MSQLVNYIISDNNIIRDAIALNMVDFELNNIKVMDELQQINSLTNILIIDRVLDESEITKLSQKQHSIRLIVNLADKIEFGFVVNIPKPISLVRLINIVNSSLKGGLFVSLDAENVYNQQKGIVASAKHEEPLTGKENLILASLIKAKNNTLTPSELMNMAWGHYHNDSKSNTAEVHLYRLKHKLPNNMLKITKENIQLLLPQI